MVLVDTFTSVRIPQGAVAVGAATHEPACDGYHLRAEEGDTLVLVGANRGGEMDQTLSLARDRLVLTTGAD